MTPRVIHFIPSLGPGGAERQISLLAPAMVTTGIQVAVAYRRGGPNLVHLERKGVDLFELPRRSNQDPRLITDLRRVMRHWQPDLVQTWLLQMDVMGSLAAHWAGIPHVLSERSSAALYTHGWKMTLRVLLGRRAHAIVANSQGGVDYWRSRGAPCPLHVVPNGLSPLDLRPPGNTLGLEETPLLVAAGRLSHEKNVPGLVAALAAALQQLPTHQAVIFGEGPLRANAEALIAATPVASRIHLGGFTDRLGWWLQRASAFLSASFMEGHPNVVIEAAAAGCPLVLSDIPAHREVTDECGALFAPCDDAHGLAAGLVASVTHIASTQRRVAHMHHATQSLRIERAASRYADIYRAVTARTVQ